MRRRLVVAVVAAVALGGGIALAVQDDTSACKRYETAAEREDYASFEAQQRAQAEALAECMAEQNRSAP